MRINYKIIMLMILLSFLFSGCQTSPAFTPEGTKAEPSYLKPSEYVDDFNKVVTLIYTIKNPTNLDFTGKVSYQYNKECIRLSEEETKVNVKIDKKEDSYSVKVSPTVGNRWEAYKEGCYGTQKILLVLRNKEGTIVYSSQSVDITITR